jgi:nucleoside-diphosphate-sugar epimerase
MAELQYSSYGQLKLIGEKIANDIGGLTVRLWNVYSQSSDQTYSDKSHVITDFVYMVKNYNKIKVRTNGEECRQFLYAEDCAECFLTLAKNYNELDKSKNYHITSFEWTSIKDIALTMSKITGCEISFSEKKDLTHMNAMNEPDNYILNFWQPKTTIESGIKMMLESSNCFKL